MNGSSKIDTLHDRLSLIVNGLNAKLFQFRKAMCLKQSLPLEFIIGQNTASMDNQMQAGKRWKANWNFGYDNMFRHDVPSNLDA